MSSGRTESPYRRTAFETDSRWRGENNPGLKLSVNAWRDRIPWLCNLHDILLRDVASGQHVVLACSALKKMYRDILTQGKDGAAPKCKESGREAKWAKIQLLVVHLSGSFEVISERLLKRKGHFMPPELLQSQFETLEPPAAPEKFIQISVNKNVSKIIATIMETLKMK
ncbi:putative gluconokinase isoform X3 [Callithrix jacchus]